jgi:hypothetical protein
MATRRRTPASTGKEVQASEEPQITPTVSFRPSGFESFDRVIGEEKAGHVKQKLGTYEQATGTASKLPPPQREAPTTSLSSRLREQGGQ